MFTSPRTSASVIVSFFRGARRLMFTLCCLASSGFATSPPSPAVDLPPLLSGADAYQLLRSKDPRHAKIQWLYSGDSSLVPLLSQARKINWQAFVHTDKEGVKWKLKTLTDVAAQLVADYQLKKDLPIVVFGDSITKFLLLSSGWGEEGRIAWMLEAAGFPRVSLVDGGYKAILAKSPSHAFSTQFRKGDNTAPKSISFAELSAHQAKDPSSHIIVDTRSWDEYRGLRSYVGVKGRIAGARHFHVDDFFDNDGKIRPIAELSLKLAKLGIDGKKPIVTYCSGGVRSAMAYYILRYHLGFPEVANFDGSWAEWSKRSKTFWKPTP